ncbi:MAG: ORF6N domain-containing protein [candidate division NC10 bacterium]|nr:ORF6N domain-containing protein [candidate division NC10 bacterium]MDE2321794.1 ORF6N domain-containing protein [candidate division NC10 bacterium]
MSLRGVLSPAPNIERTRKRFPDDFMFRLTVAEKAEVITHTVIAFTERGAIMAAMVQANRRASPTKSLSPGGREWG